MYRLVQQVVEAFVQREQRADVETDRVVCLDVTNRAIDGYCYLFFGPDHASPVVVAKLAATELGKRIFRTEFHNLEILERIGMNATRTTTPRPLDLVEQGEHLVTLQSGLPGTLMKNLPGSELFSAALVADNFSRVVDWWSDFQRRYGTLPVTLSDEEYERRVLHEVHKFRRRYLVSDAESAFLTERFETSRMLYGTTLPYMAQHGDFCAANMMLDQGRLGVFDWEFPLEHLTPLFDLLHFYASVRYPYEGLRVESSHFDSFVAVYWGQNYFADEVRRSLARVCDEFAIPGETLGDLLILSLLHVANLKFEALVTSHGLTEPGDDSDDAKRRMWAQFDLQNKNVPFACIRDGSLANLSHIVEHGLPDFSMPPAGR